MLKEQVMKDKIVAMKAGNVEVRNLLGVLLGEFERAEKSEKHLKVPIVEQDYQDIVKKTIESCKLCGNDSEAEILSIYMPKQLSEKELEDAILLAMKENNLLFKKDMGVIMKLLKEKYNGMYDGKTASIIVVKHLI
jgi:uncharacterized protein YqeY